LLSPYSTPLNTGFEGSFEPKIAVFEQKMIASKNEDSVLKRSNRIRRGVENRLSLFSALSKILLNKISIHAGSGGGISSQWLLEINGHSTIPPPEEIWVCELNIFKCPQTQYSWVSKIYCGIQAKRKLWE